MNEEVPDREEPDIAASADVSPLPATRGYLAGAEAQLRHALRTPLNHVIGYSEMLLETAQARGLDDIAADLRNIHAAGRELLTLIDDMLNPQVLEPGPSPPPLGEPVVTDTAPAPPPPVAQLGDGAPGARAQRVLLVDDNAGNRDVVTRLLGREGYAVLQAENGRRALDLLASESVDLVLLDVMMPVMDGIEACRRLKEDPETRLIPVVMMTALGQVDDRVRALRAGADDFLTKPVNRDELLARIQTSLRLKQTVDSKLDRLRGAQEYLARFVPRSVIQQLEQNPDAPVLEKTDQDLSAMFVDVSGYGKLSESLRQTADFMVEKYFSRFLDVIHLHHGDLTETSGDGLMVVFPGDDPVDHATNAVRASLDILRVTGDLNEQLKGIFDPMAVHIGINSGIALIGPTRYEWSGGARWTFTALGPSVNLAARIADVAEAGMICIGPETARRVEGRFTTISLGSRELKNVKGEVEVHQVVSASQDRRA